MRVPFWEINCCWNNAMRRTMSTCDVGVIIFFSSNAEITFIPISWVIELYLCIHPLVTLSGTPSYFRLLAMLWFPRIPSWSWRGLDYNMLLGWQNCMFLESFLWLFYKAFTFLYLRLLVLFKLFINLWEFFSKIYFIWQCFYFYCYCSALPNHLKAIGPTLTNITLKTVDTENSFDLRGVAFDTMGVLLRCIPSLVSDKVDLIKNLMIRCEVCILCVFLITWGFFAELSIY